MNIRSIYILFFYVFATVENASASTSEYLSPYFFGFALIPFFILGPLGFILGLSFSKEKAILFKILNSIIGVSFGYLLSYGLICLIELFQL